MAPAPQSLRRLRWRMRVAIVRGRLDMYRPYRGAESVRAVLQRRFSDRHPKRIERRYLEFRRRYSVVLRWIAEGMEEVERVVRIDGLGHLEEALRGGSGAILASAHFGHGRLIKPVLRAHGCPALLVGDLTHHERWPAIAAEDLPTTLNLRPHFAALRANRPLIILVDGRLASSHTHFLASGIGFEFTPGAMRIARASGAPLLPAFVVDDGTLRDPLAIRLVIRPPLALQTSDDAVGDALENLKRFAAVYAQELESNPHNLTWRWVDVESGTWMPPPLWGLEDEPEPWFGVLAAIGKAHRR